MYILLKEGDVIREGDELSMRSVGSSGNVFWRCFPAYQVGGRFDKGFSMPARRKLTGWEAVKHALETEVLGNNKEGCETTKLFWNCKCATDYIREPADADQCQRCLAVNIASTDARKAEVILKIMEEQ